MSLPSINMVEEIKNLDDFINLFIKGKEKLTPRIKVNFKVVDILDNQNLKIKIIKSLTAKKHGFDLQTQPVSLTCTCKSTIPYSIGDEYGEYIRIDKFRKNGKIINNGLDKQDQKIESMKKRYSVDSTLSIMNKLFKLYDFMIQNYDDLPKEILNKIENDYALNSLFERNEEDE